MGIAVRLWWAGGVSLPEWVFYHEDRKGLRCFTTKTERAMKGHEENLIYLGCPGILFTTEEQRGRRFTEKI
jgi:hypothetical protein